MTDARRLLPSIDALLASDAVAGLLRRYPRERVATALRRGLDEARESIGAGGEPGDVADAARWAAAATRLLEKDDVPSLRPVVNATGVVLHTNLGRAPVAEVARRAMAEVAAGYTNLEYDLERGTRGSRYEHCVRLLVELMGGDAALVVNNAAAALVLAVGTVAHGRGVAVSRGELVEIGGGFRIPEILGRSGAHLVEVGSTNRTRARDYAESLAGGDVAAFLKVHRSNFRMTGFTEDASLEALAPLAREAGVPLLFDLGSGMLADPASLGLPHEPRAAEALRAGADVVIASGDKLLGGPQAGILVGRRDLIEAMRGNPLCRALRVDKVTLAGLEATLRLYLDPVRAMSEIPILRMLAEPAEHLRGRAEAVASRLREKGVEARVEAVTGAVGGGTYPETGLPSWAVVVIGGPPSMIAEGLRRGDPPVVGRIEDDRMLLDMRTVDPGESDALVRRVLETIGTQAS